MVYADIKQKQDLGHTKLNPLHYAEFHRDLADVFGVVTNAGFELTRESLTLGKKLLVRPLTGQYEQLWRDVNFTDGFDCRLARSILVGSEFAGES